MLERVAAGALVAWLALAAVARAQTPEEDFAAGVAAFDAGDHAGALAAFRRSYEARPVPDVLYNIAVSEEHLGRVVEAVRDYERYLLRATTRALRADAERRLRELAPRVARVSLAIYPAGATVIVDGEPAGRAPLESSVVLAPGLHVVVVAHAGYRTARRELSVEGGRMEEIPIALQPEAGRADGPAPPARRRELAVGGPTDGDDGPGVLPPLLVVTAAVALVTGGLLFALGASDRASVEDPPMGARWSDVEDAYGRAATLQNVGLTLVISGVVTGAIGAGLWASR